MYVKGKAFIKNGKNEFIHCKINETLVNAPEYGEAG